MMEVVLNTFRLAEPQLKTLTHCAEVAGALLDEDYMGEFRPADEPRCVALMCSDPGQLMRFGALVTLAYPPPDPLLGELAVRVCEDKCGCGRHRDYYWPGVVKA